MSDPEKRDKFDLKGFAVDKNGKEVRWPEIEACAKALKGELGFKKVGAVGYCYGGWAVFKLGDKSKCKAATGTTTIMDADMARQPSG